MQAFPKGRKRECDCRAACGTSRFYPKTDRARARYKQGREPAGLPAGDGRGCSVGRPAPSSTRLPLSGRLTTRKVRLTSGKHAESPQDTTQTPLRQAGREPTRPDSKDLAAFRLSPAPAASAAFALHAPSKGQFPLPAAPAPGMEVFPLAGHAASRARRERRFAAAARRASSL